MARKKRVVEAPKRASSPPAASLSDEELQHEEPDRNDVETNQNDTDDEEPITADDEDEEEDEITPAGPTKVKTFGPGSDSDVDSESTPPSPSLSDYTIKPITLRRPAAKLEPEKAMRKELSSSSSTPNGGPIQRLWSEHDEIELLKGMVRFRSEKGMDPNLVMNVFHEFIKGSFSVEMVKNQLVSKIKRLKKKYVANCAKAANGKDLVSMNPHEMKAFELSKKVWGGDGGGSNAPKVKVKIPSGIDGGTSNAPKVRVKVPSGGDDGGGVAGGDVRCVTLALPCGGGEAFGLSKIKERKMKPEKKALICALKINIEEDEGRDMEEQDAEAEEDAGEDSWESGFPFLSKGLEMEGLTEGAKETVRKRIREADKMLLGKLQGLERKWKKLKKAELELVVKRTELVAEQVNLVLNIMKSE